MIQTTFEFLDAELLANDVIVKARQRKPKAKQPQDNQKQRNLFSLPPVQLSEQSLPAVPELPPKVSTTGDPEIDAVLWLHEVISTGQAALIEKAMLAAKEIKTPLTVLKKRYVKFIDAKNPGNFFQGLAAMDFDDLGSLATTSIDKATRRHEAYSRFGDAVFVETPAEIFCIEAMYGLDTDGFGLHFDDETDDIFNARQDLMPHTLSDCLHEMRYWNDLYRLRSAFPEYYESLAESNAREHFVFRCLARIPPRNKTEAVAVFQYLIENKRMEHGESEAKDIILNLLQNAP